VGDGACNTQVAKTPEALAQWICLAFTHLGIRFLVRSMRLLQQQAEYAFSFKETQLAAELSA